MRPFVSALCLLLGAPARAAAQDGAPREDTSRAADGEERAAAETPRASLAERVRAAAESRACCEP